MKEPKAEMWDGSLVPFSCLCVDDLRYIAASDACQHLNGMDEVLPADGDFRRRYAAILLRERGL